MIPESSHTQIPLGDKASSQGNPNVGYAEPVGTAQVVPMVQTMQRVQFAGSTGIVIRQQTQYLEVAASMVGVPYEQKNKYVISWMPIEKNVGKHASDPQRWVPSGSELKQLNTLMMANEESSCLTRACFKCMGCNSSRPFKMHYHIPGLQDQFFQDRKFRLGGGCGCPHESHVFYPPGQPGGAPVEIARVYEDMHCGKNYCQRFWQSCCTCTQFVGVHVPDAQDQGKLKQKYTFRMNFCCCGGSSNNFCGNTCCKSDQVFDVLNENGEIVANLQATYGGDANCGAFCRMMFQFSNFLLSFPPEATEEERVALIAAVLQIEYMFFEKDDDDNNQNDMASAAFS